MNTFTSPNVDVLTAYQWIIYINAISVALTTLEYLSINRQFSDRGYYSWKLFRTAGAAQLLSSLQNLLFGRAGTTTILAARLIAAASATMFPFRSWQQWCALAGLALLSCLLTGRQRYGEDGADQMTLIVGVTLCLVVGPFQDESLLIVGVWFIALQAMLAYLSAGVAKAIAPVWQSGEAVGLIVNTASYGSKGFGEFLKSHPIVGKVMTWGTVLFELSFAAMIFLPWPAPAIALAAGVSFHIGIALVMGLNNFVPAFLSTYPALLVVSALFAG